MAAKLEARAVGTSSLRRTVPELCRETRESVSPAAAARFCPYPRRVPARRIQLVAAVVGAASLGAEIAAARLLAPWFGASTVMWANTIATVLVALSAGYWVGGRLADRDPTLAGLSGSCSARRRCWRSCLSSPGRSCACPSRRSTAFRPAPSPVAAGRAAARGRAGAAPRGGRAVRGAAERPRRSRRPAAWRGGCTRSRRSAAWSGASSARCARPVRGHAAHVPGLRPVAGDRRRARAGAALRARADRARRADRDPGRDGQGDRRRAGDLGRGRPSTSTPGSWRRTTASAASSSTRARRSTPSTAPASG